MQKMINLAEIVRNLRKLEPEQSKAFKDLIEFYQEIEDQKPVIFEAIKNNTENTVEIVSSALQETVQKIPQEYFQEF